MSHGYPRLGSRPGAFQLKRRFAAALILAALAAALVSPRPAAAQVYNPPAPVTGPDGAYMPSYSPYYYEEENETAWNVESVINAFISAYVATMPDVDIDSGLVINDVVGSISTAAKYAPLQSGFYINHLGFESELARGVTLFGDLRNQDDYDKAADLKVRDGHLDYDLQYEKLVNWQVVPESFPNSGAADVTPFFGWPDHPGFPQLLNDSQVLFNLPGFETNPEYYPRIDDFLVNNLHYTFNNGFGVFASNQLIFATGTSLLESEGIQGPEGINNNYSATTGGVDYTSPGNLQFYASDTDTNWNNKQNTGFVGLPLAVQYGGEFVAQPPPYDEEAPCYQDGPNGSCVSFGAPASVPNFKDDDTFWNMAQAGLRVPLSKSVSFTGSWKEWNETTSGVFGDINADTGENIPLDTELIESGPDAGDGLIPTGLQPDLRLEQFRGRIDFLLGRNDAGVINFGHWDDEPDDSILHETDRSRNNALMSYRHTFGDQTFSLFGGWEGETIQRTVDYRETRIWDAFNPLLSTVFDSSMLGTAVFNGASVTFTPNPGVAIAPFTTPIAAPCVNGCGANTITYPVGGVEYVPGVGEIPVVAPLGIESFTSNNYVAQFGADGTILDNLFYNVRMERDLADRTLFRIDPQNQWQNHFELTWAPAPRLSIDAGLDTLDNHTNSQWIYPYAEHENDFTFVTSYELTRAFGLFAQYSNFTEKFDFTSPVLNTGSQNFIGPPAFGGPYGFLPTVDSAGYIGLFAPFAQTLSDPLDSIAENVADQDQEISVGTRWRMGRNWTASLNFTHSRPQTYQGISLTNPVTLASMFGTYMPNVPAGFYAALPEMLVMQEVNGRRNDYTFHLSRMLGDDARIGMFFDLAWFKNLAPQISAIGIPCGAYGTPVYCANGTSYGLNPYQYGENINDGQLLTTEIFYSRNF